MTTADLLDAIGTNLQDQDEVKYTSTMKLQKLNEVQRDIARRTGWIEDQAQLTLDATLSPNGAFYTLPDGVVDIQRLSALGRPLSLVAVSGLCEDWETETGDPRAYITRKPKTVRLYPYSTLSSPPVLYYTRQPLDMTSSEPEIPEVFHDALIYGACAKLAATVSEGQDLAAVQYWQGEYEAALQQAIGHSPAPSYEVPYRYL